MYAPFSVAVPVASHAFPAATLGGAHANSASVCAGETSVLPLGTRVHGAVGAARNHPAAHTQMYWASVKNALACGSGWHAVRGCTHAPAGGSGLSRCGRVRLS